MSNNCETFTENQHAILEHYVTNTTSNVFALRNLPEVIKGALFSRYSRSLLGLRSLLLKEFILNEETAFQAIAGGTDEAEEQIAAIKKAQNFYDRILDGYGDDSIGELGGAHLALESISMLATKVIEDCRIGGSPLEKSTRYIYFDQKVDKEFLFYKEPILMASAHRDLYLQTCNALFETYSSLIPPLTEKIGATFPKEEGISQVAYNAALRAKVLDCLRGLLPASTLTNMGVYGNGRFFETLMQKLHAESLAELQDVGRKAHKELAKIIPSFVRRGELGHKHQKAHADYLQHVDSSIKTLVGRYTLPETLGTQPGVRLIARDPDARYKVAAALLFDHTHAPFDALLSACKEMSEEELSTLLDAAALPRQNRRHKSPRALECATFTFEIVADYGIYRDLHRHRLLTQERQLLTCDLGFFVPQEILGTELEEKYLQAMRGAEQAYRQIASAFPEEAQYVVPMAYNIRWLYHINLRALQWLCELRSAPQGHPNYRFIAQELAKETIKAEPFFERFFKFVDWEGQELGRLGQELRIAQKKGV